MRTLLPYGSAVPNPVLYSVTASGPYRRPAARRRSASATPPFQGLGSSQNKFVSAAKNAAQTSSGPRQESTSWPLGAGPTRSASPCVTRAGYGKSTKRRHHHVSEQSNPHRLSRQRRRSSHH